MVRSEAGLAGYPGQRTSDLLPGYQWVFQLTLQSSEIILPFSPKLHCLVMCTLKKVAGSGGGSQLQENIIQCALSLCAILPPPLALPSQQ